MSQRGRCYEANLCRLCRELGSQASLPVALSDTVARRQGYTVYVLAQSP